MAGLPAADTALPAQPDLANGLPIGRVVWAVASLPNLDAISADRPHQLGETAPTRSWCLSWKGTTAIMGPNLVVPQMAGDAPKEWESLYSGGLDALGGLYEVA